MKKPQKRTVVIVILLGVAVAGFLFLKYSAPIKGSYDQDTQEVVISPGFFYTLEGYFTLGRDNTFIESGEILKPLSAASEKKYHFRCIPGESDVQTLVISYRNRLTGEHTNHGMRVQRIGDLRFVSVIGGSFTLVFNY